jgi:hypothetical protein
MATPVVTYCPWKSKLNGYVTTRIPIVTQCPWKNRLNGNSCNYTVSVEKQIEWQLL